MSEQIAKDEKVKEAVRRMELLGVAKEAIENFQKEGLVPFFITGTRENRLRLYPPKDNIIAELEERLHVLVYCVIYSKKDMIGMESFLFISDYKEEWQQECEDAKDGYVMTWTENLIYPHLSEFGTIAVCVTKNGALNREW